MSLLFFRSLVEKTLIRNQSLNLALRGEAYVQKNFHSISGLRPTNQGILASESALGNVASSPWSLTSIRTKIRNNWPRPNEKKRLKMSFWNRMKTPGGRAVIMRRFLKGRHVLSH